MPDRPAGRPSGPRRRALTRGLALAAAWPATGTARAAPAEPAADRPAWMREPGAPFSPYGQPSPHEKAVTRRLSASRAVPGNGVSLTPLDELEGTLTPSGLHFERHHNGVPDIDPAAHQFVIHGRVRQPLRFGVAQLLRYPMRSHLGFLECGGNSNAMWHPEPLQRPVGSFHGLVSCSEWTGVPLSLLLDEAGAAPDAAWAVAEGADAYAMAVSVPVRKLREDALVALYQNGERLRPEHGYPMRLIVPGWEGVLHVKWLRALELSDRPSMTRDETAKYTELLPDGTARQFSFVMEVKSLITAPSHGHRLAGRGPVALSGLAWSGRGRIRRVEVSVDGGRRWAEAPLDAPVLPRCFTRFRLPWAWDGRPAVLMSRATDETGAVQPTRAELLQRRGANAYFHYHGITAWAVDDDGQVRHVYA